MRKKLLIVILMLVCFWHFNVKAKEGELVESSSSSVGEVETSDVGSTDEEKSRDVLNEDSSVSSDSLDTESQPDIFLEQNHDDTINANLSEEEKSEEKNIDKKSGVEETTEVADEEINADSNLVDAGEQTINEIDSNVENESNIENETNVDNNVTNAVNSNDNKIDNQDNVSKNDDNISQDEIENNKVATPEKNVQSESDILFGAKAIDGEENTEDDTTEENITYEYAMAKEDKLTVSNLLKELEIILPEGTTVSSVISSDTSKVKVENDIVECLDTIDPSNAPILTITLSDGTTYTITIKKAPEHNKKLYDNEDGTYDIELTVTGETEEVITKANVIIVMDASNSMVQSSTRVPYTYSSDTYDSNREYYNSASGGNHVYYQNNRWERRNGNVYTGDVWVVLTRLEAEKEALCDLVDELLANNDSEDEDKKDIIEISIITYNATASSDVLSNSSDATTIKNKINSVTNDQGTNWESGMKAAVREAETLRNSEKKEEVYTIFLTDGQPTEYDLEDGTHSEVNVNNYWLNWSPAMDEARELAEKYHLYTIFTYGDNATYINYLNNLTHYAYQKRDYDNNNDDTDGKYNYGSSDATLGQNEHFFDARNTSALVDAFRKIAEDINTSGIGDVNIVDGTTNKVTSSVGLTHNLLSVDKSSFRYYIDNDPWTTIPASAKAELNSDGEVVWDLSSLELLENGKTYKVRFTVWPSQDTLDLIADLKNGTIKYDYDENDIVFDSVSKKYYLKDSDGNKTSQEVIDPEIKQYLIKNGDNYNLRTNTTATLTFTDNRPNGTEDGNASYVNPNPVGTTAVEMLTVTKKWYGDKERDVEFWVSRDEEAWYQIPMDTQEDEISGGAYIAVGIIRDGVVLETGHEYSFMELGNDAYHWELKENKIIRPMIIDNALTILERDDSATENYYTIGNHKYVAADSTVTKIELLAENYRRANLDIKKVVTGDYNPEGYGFKFTITASSPKTSDPHDDYIWFTVYGDKGNVDESGNSILSKLTAEVVAALTSFYGDGENQVHAEVDENGEMNGTFYILSGKTFEILMQDTWSLRIKNLLTGSKYTITESTGSEYELVSINGDESATSVSGEITTIGETPSYTFENKFKVRNVTVTKVWDGPESQDNPERPEVKVQLYAGETAQGNPVTLTETGNWTYTWKNLPVSIDGQNITYSVKEITGDMIVESRTPGKYTYTLSGNQTNGYVVTNTYVPLVTSVTVTKEWAGPEAQDNPERPEVKVQLYAGETAQGNPVTLTATGDWTYTWTGLAANNAGADINYIVREVTGGNIVTQDTPGKYTYTLSGNEADGYVVTNTYVPLETSVTVTKEWAGAEAQDNATRPEVTIELLKEGSTEVIDTQVLSENKGWTYTWTGLAANAAGADINYIVREVTGGNIVTQDTPGKYTYTLSGNEADGYVVTNTYVPLVTSVTVTKEWAGAESQDNPERPEVTIELLKEGSTEVIDTQVLSENKGWTYTWTGLAANNAGADINYIVREVTGGNIVTQDTPGKYTYTLSGNEADGYVVTNTYVPLETSVSVTKKWSDNSNQDGAHPASVKVQLYANGDKLGDEITLNGDNEWTYIWKELALNVSGEKIDYTVKEVESDIFKDATEVKEQEEGKYYFTVDGSHEDGFTITNTYVPETIDITVEKIWKDESNKEGFRPETITIELLANGIKVDEVVLSGDGNEWSHTFTGLDKYADGKEIEYTVNEFKVDKYETTIDGLTITNSRDVEYTSATVKKVWNDADNQDGIRPESITVTLSNGTKVVLTEENNWTATVNDLIKYANGEEIEYTWTEVDVEGYTLTDTTTDGTVTTFTNTHEPAVTSVSVEKVWADDENESGKRPESVTIALLANGKEFDEIVLSESNEWKHTFNDLPMYNDGEEIEYSILEKEVPEGYEVSIEETEAGFIVHNVLGQGDHEPPHNNPQTGDNIVLYLIALLVSLIGIVSGKLYLKDNN